MRYRVKTQWIKVAVDGIGDAMRPSCAVSGVTGEYQGEATEGLEFETIISCDPALIPQIEATGTVILETLGE